MEIILLIIILFLAIYTLRKISRMDMMLSQIRNQLERLYSNGLDNLFHQIEAINSLYLDLSLKKSIPRTRGWHASPDFLLQIADYALDKKPEIVVECGSGVSTIILARCMEMNGKGHVYSLEHLLEYAQKNRDNLNRHGLSEWATIDHAPFREYELKGERWPYYSIEPLNGIHIDMLVIDGPPRDTRRLARFPAGPLLFHRLNPGGAIFLDDANRSDEREILTCWTEEYPNLRQEVRSCEKGCVILYKDKG